MLLIRLVNADFRGCLLYEYVAELQFCHSFLTTAPKSETINMMHRPLAYTLKVGPYYIPLY